MREATLSRPHKVGSGSGTQRIYRFNNGYGASVVQFSIDSMGGSYGAESGLWELAVVKFNGAEINDFKLDYSTPITSDVEGYLSESAVDELLAKIEALPKAAS